MIRRLIALIGGLVIALAATLPLVGAQTAPEITPLPTRSILLVEDAFIRSGPSESFVAVGRVLPGAPLTALNRSEDGRWVLIRYNRGFGWIRRDLVLWAVNVDTLPVLTGDLTPTVVPGEPTATLFLPTNTPTGNYVRVSATSAYLRGGPGVTYLRLGQLFPGEPLDPVGRNEDSSWVLIRTDDGFAWIRGDLGSWVSDLTALPILLESRLTPSLTFTPSNTVTASPTSTDTPESSATPTATATPTDTATASATNTATPTITASPTLTPSTTPSATLTATKTASATETETPPPTETGTATTTPSATHTETAVPTVEASATSVPTVTHTVNPTSTASETPSAQPTETATNLPAATNTDTPTATNTTEPTATETDVPTAAPTDEPSATETTLPAATETDVLTSVPADTSEPATRAAALASTATELDTATARPSASATDVPTATPTPSATDTPTDVPTETALPTNTATHTPSPSDTAQASPTAAESPTVSVVETSTLAPMPTDTDTSVPEPTATHTQDTTAVAAVITVTTAPPTPTATAQPTLAPSAAAGVSSRVRPELVAAGALLLLIIGYVALYLRGAATAGKYSAGFVIEDCPVCREGKLLIEARTERSLGIPRTKHVVRCNHCRSVLRESGGGRWRYAVDRSANTQLYDRLNNREIREDTLKRLLDTSSEGSGSRVSPEIVDDEPQS